MRQLLSHNHDETMKPLTCVACALLMAVACSGCKPSPSATVKAPPAKVTQVAKEESLANVVLTPEAEQRLGITTVAVTRKQVARSRTFGGELLLALGRALRSTGGVDSASPPSHGQSIFSLLPAMTPAEIIRVSEMQLEADGQVAAARVQVQAANIALKRAENLLAEKAGSIRAVDEAKAQVALAETALQTALSRRELLGAPLFEAVKHDVLWVRVPVYVGDAQQIKKSEPARVGDLGARTNHVTRLASPVSVPISTSNGSATVDLFYEIENKDGLFRPGQKVAVRILLAGEDQGLAVPASALLYDIHGDTWVYENTAPKGFTRRRVEVRFVEGDEAILARGLQAGAKIVTVGAAELFGAEFGFGK